MANLGDTCTCKNVIKSIEYSFLLEQDDEKYIFNKKSDDSKISAKVVLYKNDFEAKCDENLGVQQSFKIDFLTTDEVIQKRSGNPGYMDGYPIKIGIQREKGEPIDSYIDGFQLTGADKQGHCILEANEEGIRDLEDPVVKFNIDLAYGCTKGFSWQQFKEFCEAEKWDSQAQV